MTTTAATTESNKKALAAIVGKKNIADDPETLKHYSCDTSLLPPHMPDMVVKKLSFPFVIQVHCESLWPSFPKSRIAT